MSGWQPYQFQVMSGSTSDGTQTYTESNFVQSNPEPQTGDVICGMIYNIGMATASGVKARVRHYFPLKNGTENSVAGQGFEEMFGEHQEVGDGFTGQNFIVPAADKLSFFHPWVLTATMDAQVFFQSNPGAGATYSLTLFGARFFG
jgi:hypothetical protein